MASRLSSRAHSYSNQRRQYSATNPTLNEAWQLPSVIHCNTLVDHFVNISTTSMRIRITIYIHMQAVSEEKADRGLETTISDQNDS